jgi:hypothetical protein
MSTKTKEEWKQAPLMATGVQRRDRAVAMHLHAQRMPGGIGAAIVIYDNDVIAPAEQCANNVVRSARLGH